AVTPVTVIEAGPCPVVQVRTAELDGFEAVQLAFDAVPERKLSRPELGHLRKFGVGPHRTLVEFRGPIDGGVVGEAVTVEVFQPGDEVKVSGLGIGKGFQGTIKRHNFGSGPRAHGSHNVRAPGTEPAARQGLGAGTEERDRGGARLMAAPTAPVLGGSATKEVALDEAVFAADVKPHLVHEAVRAELNARRAGTAASKSRGQVSGGRSKPWRQKGTGRARAGTIRAAQFTGGGHAFAKTPRRFVQKVNRKV